ncbi:MAG: SPOR domain-containing protein [Alphaproteobacteria bacterium]|nr:SPOR domain-containing protein [Alphaproteobacteria bacterium]
MRPDMDDYAELDEGKPVGSARAMSWMVLAVAVGGFAALAYYAYHSGSQSIAGDEALLIEADVSPIKEAPVDADGEQFPNQDKTIYDVISPAGEAKTAEKLLPEPERPVSAANFEDAEESSVTPPVAASPAPVAVAAAATTTFIAPAVTQAEKAIENAPVTAPTPTPTPAVPPVVAAVKKSFASPEMVNEKTLTGAKEAVEKPKAVAAPAGREMAGGAYKIQLGAYQSEAEAQAAWKKISAAHAQVLSGAPTVVKAEVKGSTFYRLRAGSYASADAAKAACAKLGGQACFPVK